MGIDMKRCFLFLCMTGLLTAALPEHAEGQVLQRIFGKEKKGSKSRKGATVPPKVPAKTQRVDYPQTRMKSRYRIDVLLPLYLDELVKNNKTTFRDRVPAKSLPAVSFYEGLKMAADTLDKKLYHVDVYVHDIGNPQTSVSSLLNHKALDSTDLLIGMVQSDDITPLGGFARKNNINFISVFSPSDGGLRDNPYFTLLQPTLHTHCDRIRNEVQKKFPGQRVIIYRRNTVPVDETAFGFVTGGREKDYHIISCNTLPERKTLAQQFDSTETNIIIIPVLDINYAESLIRQLNDWFPGYSFEVFGMPSWKSMRSLKKTEAYPNVAVNFTAPYHFDPTTSLGQQLAERYSQLYGGTPDEWVFRGYETLHWYASLLRRSGTIFNARMTDNRTALFTEYEIRPALDQNGELLYNENRHLYIYRYQGGSYMVE
jgi:hypothetical protein